MKRITLGLVIAALLSSVAVLATDGPLTALMNLRVRTDENGYLIVSGAAAGATDGPLTPMSNLRGRTNENGYLRVSLATGSVIPAPGSNTQVLFNDSGVVAGDAGLTYNKTTDALTMLGALDVAGNILSSGGNLQVRNAGTIGFVSQGVLGSTADGAWYIANAAGIISGSTLSLGGTTTSGYSSGARATSSSLLSVTGAVTLSGATTATSNIIPAGAEVVGIATTTTTTITGASGYTVGDGSDADRYGSVTGTAVGTNTGSTNYTADPRWWTNAARAVTLTALTSNFTGGVVQVTVFYRTASGT